MIKRILTHPGFWKSVLFLSLMYLLILLVIQWFITGFSSEFITLLLGSPKVWMVPIAGFIAGFMVSYGKFWAKLKRQDKNR
ncbi:MAG: hypothetical protein KTR22_03280 [Flavobacteriaceae bacterium]|nr:hypothetical protein [Flavobacteriaceae bacterium]